MPSDDRASSSSAEDLEAPEEDAIDQATPVDRAGSVPELSERGIEVPEEDAFEQSQPVPAREDDEPR